MDLELQLLANLVQCLWVYGSLSWFYGSFVDSSQVFRLNGVCLLDQGALSGAFGKLFECFLLAFLGSGGCGCLGLDGEREPGPGLFERFDFLKSFSIVDREREFPKKCLL